MLIAAEREQGETEIVLSSVTVIELEHGLRLPKKSPTTNPGQKPAAASSRTAK
jgi:hypothetical protein